MDNDGPWKEWAKALGLLWTVVLQVFTSTLVGLGAGYALWRWLHVPLALAAVTGVAGFGLGLYRMQRVLRALDGK
ncbi:MAG TPA: hypothetical protein VL588_09700 [Bdellovibrionota bacterium]|jgi:hypothetical protein|nr:hypothetical protein [Bdellovibrionota bacterium]